MIEYIRGAVAELTPTTAVVEASGVGYQLAISLNTYSALQGKAEAKLFVTEIIREDAHLLFGFANKQERQLFEQLVTVSGIGGQTARMVLSAFTPAELVTVIQTEDVRQLKAVKGIGPKAAARICVDLKDKLGDVLGADFGQQTVTAAVFAAVSQAAEEASQALVMLGFQATAVRKAVSTILKENPAASVEEIIKLGLKAL